MSTVPYQKSQKIPVIEKLWLGFTTGPKLSLSIYFSFFLTSPELKVLDSLHLIFWWLKLARRRSTCFYSTFS